MIETTIVYKNQTYNVIIGQNAQDNWNIIDNALPQDVWFHLQDFSSPHVILKNHEFLRITLIPKWLLIECGIVCKKRSSHKKDKNIDIIYTFVKNIKKGVDVGSVITDKISVLTI